MRSRHALRERLTYANVMATVAVFLALGGGAYAAAKLPRNSVGHKQLRTGSVGRTELHTGAVRSRAVKNRSLGVRDLTRKARASLRGQQGPPGDPGAAGTAFHAVITSGGDPASGNAAGIQHAAGSNAYLVRFAGDLSACTATATLGTTAAEAGAAAPAGRITVALTQGAGSCAPTIPPARQRLPTSMSWQAAERSPARFGRPLRTTQVTIRRGGQSEWGSAARTR